jgi:hypothetical protein
VNPNEIVGPRVLDTVRSSRAHGVPPAQRVIVISSVGPAPTSAASLTLYRHLVEQPGFEVSRPSVDLTALFPSTAARIIKRLRNVPRLHSFVVDLETIIYSWLPLHRRLPPPVTTPDLPVILTLAHGGGYHIARRYAALHRLPLVVRFDDWWPDLARVHRPVRRLLRRSFRRLHRDADCAICISDAMRAALGPHPNAQVIHPIPRRRPPAGVIAPSTGPLRVCYLGNMADYGPMLLALLDQIDAEEIRLEFRGHAPPWPESVTARLRREHRLHPFDDGPPFEAWFASFHVYLVAMFFDAHQRRRVETCFATKLVEYSCLGRPIVIWAPEESAVVRWAQRTGGALCVTDPHPSAVVSALRALAGDSERQACLGAAAQRAYESDFNPVTLHERFVAAIASATRQAEGSGRAPESHAWRLR